MDSDEIVQKHFELCEEVHQLLMEENRILKNKQGVPPQEFLEKKEAKLPELDASLNRLKTLKAELISPFGNTKELIKKAQNKVLQILYLDKENEELLLRNSLGHEAISIKSQISPIEAKKMFEEDRNKT